MKKGFVNIILLFAFIVGIRGHMYSQIDITSNVDTAEIGNDIELTVKSAYEPSFLLNVIDEIFLSNYYVDLERFSHVKNHSLFVDSLSEKYRLKKYGFNVDSITNQLIFSGPNIDFEITDYGKWKNTNNNIFVTNGINSNKIKIKIWDTGTFYLIPLLIKENEGRVDTLFPEGYKNYPKIIIEDPNYGDSYNRDVLENKDIIRESISWKDYKYWIDGFIAMLLLVLVFLYIKNMKSITQKEKKKVVKIIPAHVVALKKLKELKQSKPWLESTNIKEYQTKLTYSLREYLENRYKIKALEQTTGEIIDSLSSFSINENDNSTIKNILQIADLVKFAKAKVDENIHEKFLDDTIDFVNRTKEVKEIKND